MVDLWQDLQLNSKNIFPQHHLNSKSKFMTMNIKKLFRDFNEKKGVHANKVKRHTSNNHWQTPAVWPGNARRLGLHQNFERHAWPAPNLNHHAWVIAEEIRKAQLQAKPNYPQILDLHLAVHLLHPVCWRCWVFAKSYQERLWCDGRLGRQNVH